MCAPGACKRAETFPERRPVRLERSTHSAASAPKVEKLSSQGKPPVFPGRSLLTVQLDCDLKPQEEKGHTHGGQQELPPDGHGRIVGSLIYLSRIVSLLDVSSWKWPKDQQQFRTLGGNSSRKFLDSSLLADARARALPIGRSSSERSQNSLTFLAISWSIPKAHFRFLSSRTCTVSLPIFSISSTTSSPSCSGPIP